MIRLRLIRSCLNLQWVVSLAEINLLGGFRGAERFSKFSELGNIEKYSSLLEVFIENGSDQ